MTDKKPVPPSLAQFALEQLAEGVEPTATEARMGDLQVENGKLQARITEQAREIDCLKSAVLVSQRSAVAIATELRSELAALKAQTSAGVVLPERELFESWHDKAYGPQSTYNPIRSLAYDSAGVGLGYDDITVMAQFHAFKGALALNAGRAVAVPDGYVMVPVEPTQEMLDAVFPLTGESEGMRSRVNLRARRHYKAMIAAAHPATIAEDAPVAAVIGFYENEREPRLLSWNVLPNGEHRLYAAPSAPSIQQKDSGDE